MDRIRVVWQSPLIPFGPHVVRSDLPDELKALLSQSLMDIGVEDPRALDAIDRSGSRGFAAADIGLFAPLQALLAPSAGN
jgi:phosphonate transport system substrate-binding protein